MAVMPGDDSQNGVARPPPPEEPSGAVSRFGKIKVVPKFPQETTPQTAGPTPASAAGLIVHPSLSRLILIAAAWRGGAHNTGKDGPC